jgi:hypothetical protein
MMAASAVGTFTTRSVSMDKDATSTLQPAALNLACEIAWFSSTWTENRTCAPHTNDAARPTKLGASASPTFRGLKK